MTSENDMDSNSGELTKEQCQDVEQFLHLFSEIEGILKSRLRLPKGERKAVSALITKYRQVNPFWATAADQLTLFTEIRNFLTHNRNSQSGYPVAVTPGSVKTLAQIKDSLSKPESVANRFRKKVDSVSPDDSLASVVATAFEKGFSQFPVVEADRFVGLITESEITRWLGRRAAANGNQIDLTGVAVKTVIREKDPFFKDIPIFRFAKIDSAVEEVMGLFASHPVLEVALLTETGIRDASIEGIVTQWDAARFPN